MKAPERSLANHSFTLASATATAQVLYVVLTTLVVSNTSPSEFGAIAIALGAGGFLAGLLDFGFTALSVRELSAERLTTAHYCDKLATKLAVVSTISVVGLAVSGVMSQVALGAAIGAVALGRSLVMGVNVPLSATQDFRKVAGVVVAERATSLATFLVSYFVVRLAADNSFWIATCVGSGVAGLIGWLFIHQSGGIPRRLAVRNPWHKVSGYSTFSLAISAGSLDVALLGIAGGASQAGLYGAVARWTQPVMLLSQAFSSAITPTVGAAATTRSAFRSVQRFLWIPGIGIIACLMLILIAPVVVQLLIGPEYADSGKTLTCLTVGAVMVLANQPAATFLQARGYDKAVGAITALSVAMHLLGVALTADAYGAIGTALSYTASQMLLTIMLAVTAALMSRRIARVLRTRDLNSRATTRAPASSSS